MHGAQAADRVPEVTVAGVTFTADIAGALFWEDERLLVVSDLHLEKGSSFAQRGVLLPPFDTAAASCPSAIQAIPP